jgi:DNA-binding PadR family transcriptional regulator
MPDRLSAPVYNVLLALGTETRHGYAIMQHLTDLTGGAEELLPGTLYATLARMLESGLIEEARPRGDDDSGGPPRRHYRVTARGRALAQAETERMRRWVTVARRVWQPEPA